MRCRTRQRVRLSLMLLSSTLSACGPSNDLPGDSVRVASTTQASTLPASVSHPLVTAARQQIGVTVAYDPAYARIPYPGGDVPASRGVCTDVVIRALRTQGLDLQQRVHEDMHAHFTAYPQRWGLRGPDRNIDHRRVPNLQTWFARQGWSLPTTAQRDDYLPGDIVTWMLPGNLPHIGIVGDRDARPGGAPLIVHNIGRGAREENILFEYPITGHYRVKP